MKEGWQMPRGEGGRGLQPGQKINVDLNSANQRTCVCGCKYFLPVMTAYSVSALLSPTGKELPVQVPVLICLECKEILK